MATRTRLVPLSTQACAVPGKSYQILCYIGMQMGQYALMPMLHPYSTAYVAIQDLSLEQEQNGKTNIIIYTAGGLLQHIGETPGFRCDNLLVSGMRHRVLCRLILITFPGNDFSYLLYSHCFLLGYLPSPCVSIQSLV